MGRYRVVRRLLAGFAILFLLVLAWEAISGGLGQLPGATTAGQRVETVVQLAFGLLCVLTVLTCVWGRRWRVYVRTGWAASFAVASGLSAIVWGPPSVIAGLVSVLISVLVSLVVVWMLRRGIK